MTIVTSKDQSKVGRHLTVRADSSEGGSSQPGHGFSFWYTPALVTSTDMPDQDRPSAGDVIDITISSSVTGVDPASVQSTTQAAGLLGGFATEGATPAGVVKDLGTRTVITPWYK